MGRRLHGPRSAISGKTRVAQQKDADGSDTGRVLLDLNSVEGMSVYMQPRGYDEPLWEATLSSVPDSTTLSTHELATLAAELVVANNLCTFLPWRSLEWDRDRGTHDARAPPPGEMPPATCSIKQAPRASWC